MKKLSVLMLALFFCAGVSFAAGTGASKSYESSTKIGLGYSKYRLNGNFGNAVDLDSVAARFWFDNNLGVDVSLGFNTGDSRNVIVLGAKMMGKFITIHKLNIYWLGGLAIGSYDPKIDGSDTFTVFKINGGIGAEYYLLPCLSLLTEVGLQFTSLNGNGNNVNDFGVYADWLPQAGIRFYFN